MRPLNVGSAVACFIAFGKKENEYNGKGKDGRRSVATMNAVFATPSAIWIALFASIFARCFGTTLFAPIFGGADVPKTVRIVVAAALAALVFPSASAHLDANPGTIFESSERLTLFFVGVVFLTEFLFGVATGLTLRLFFCGAILAGETIARIGGISVAGTFDPTFGEEISPISRFLFLLAIAVFATTGGVELFLEGFLDGFVAVAPGSVALNETLILGLTEILALSFALALKIAAPVIFATGAVYLATGFLSRVVPQLNIMSISFNCNAALTSAILALTIGFSCRTFQTEIVELLEKTFVRSI